MPVNLVKEIESYTPYNRQEEKDKEQILAFLRTGKTPLSRENGLAHMTASAWIVNADRTKVLMCYHDLYDSWSWTGGHADGDGNLLRVSLREAAEETGLKSVRPVSEEIVSLEILTVDGHEKQGEYVPSHLHMNVTYLLEADETEPLLIRKGENSALQWFSPEEALKASAEPWFVKRIYSKLIEKSRTAG